MGKNNQESSFWSWLNVLPRIGKVVGALWATPLCPPGTACENQNLESLRRVSERNLSIGFSMGFPWGFHGFSMGFSIFSPQPLSLGLAGTLFGWCSFRILLNHSDVDVVFRSCGFVLTRSDQNHSKSDKSMNWWVSEFGVLWADLTRDLMVRFSFS